MKPSQKWHKTTKKPNLLVYRNTPSGQIYSISIPLLLGETSALVISMATPLFPTQVDPVISLQEFQCIYYPSRVTHPKARLFTEQMEECIVAGVLSICRFSMPVTADSHERAWLFRLMAVSDCSGCEKQL